MRKPNVKKLQAQVDAWNAAHPVGAAVIVLTDTRGPIATRTRSEAQVLSGHTAVIWLDGISGCYDLDRVHLRIPHESPKQRTNG